MPITVICDECSESHRVREDAAGKRFKCKGCGKGLTIEAPRKKRAASDEEDYEDYDEDDEDEDYDDAEPVRRRTAGRSKARSSSRSKRSKSLPIHKTMIVPGLRLVATGFGLQVLCFVCIVLFFPLARAGVINPNNLMTVAKGMAVLMICSSVATAIGKVLCMSAPPQMSGKPFIYLAAVADVAILCISLGSFFVIIPPVLSQSESLIAIIGTYFFVLFLRELGRFQRDDNITDRATHLLNLCGVLIGIMLSIIAGFFVNFINPVAWIVLSMIFGIVAFILVFVCVVIYAMLLSASLDSVS